MFLKRYNEVLLYLLIQQNEVMKMFDTLNEVAARKTVNLIVEGSIQKDSPVSVLQMAATEEKSKIVYEPETKSLVLSINRQLCLHRLEILNSEKPPVLFDSVDDSSSFPFSSLEVTGMNPIKSFTIVDVYDDSYD